MARLESQAMMMNDDLYPYTEPHEVGRLAVGDGHELAYAVHGNPDGTPAVVLHGGPAAGRSPMHPRFFDPSAYRVVTFDQRGAGDSTPLGSLHCNTTQHLVGDIELLREHLCIDQWLVFGGSWGSTLAMAYAAAHADRCSALILRGIWLCRPSDLDWWFGQIRGVYPDYWDDFVAVIPESERHDLLGAYARRLAHPDPAIHLPVAEAWEIYETRGSSILGTLGALPSPDALLATVRIKAHYMQHGSFVADGALLDGASAFAHVPGVIVHGRYDLLCFLDGAVALSKRWPNAQLVVVPDAGHSALEPGIRRALVAATDQFRTR